MSIYDGLIILVLLLLLFLGFQKGIIKQATDFGVLLVLMIISSPLSKLLCNLLYPVLPFLNFSGKVKGIKSINLITWRLVIYFILIAILFFIVRRIFIRLKISRKLKDSEVDAGMVSKLLGIVMAFPFAVLVIYNVLLVVNVPLMSFSIKEESKVAEIVLEKTLIISNLNEDVYLTSNYARNQIYDGKNSEKNYKKVNMKIVNNMINNNLVKSKVVKKLDKKGKLVGTKVTIIDEIEEDVGIDDSTND